MHSSGFINQAIINAIVSGSQAIGVYLSSRVQKVSHMFQTQTQHSVNEKVARNSPANGEYGVLTAQVWDCEGKMQNKMFKDDGTLVSMETKFIDVVHLYQNTELGMMFVRALSYAENDIFLNDCV